MTPGREFTTSSGLRGQQSNAVRWSMLQHFSRFWALGLILLASCHDGKDGSVTDTAQDATDGRLRVLTYNVHGLPGAITGDDTADRMRQISARITAHDIVGLQEDFDTDNHDMLIEPSTHATRLWFGDPLPDRFYGSGLSLLADAPLLDHLHEHFTTCNGTVDAASDCLASKGFQAARVRLGTATLDIYNTHLEAGGGEADNIARAAQVDALVAALEGWSAGQAVIFTGDFNLRETDPEDLPLIEQLLRETGLARTCWAVDCEAPHHIDKVLFRSSTDLQLRVDAWSNIEADFRDDDDIPLSDHPAIEAMFEWSTN